MPSTSPNLPITLSLKEAQQRIQASLAPISASELVALGNALDRVCSEPIIAPINVPAFTNSAMDGYAICAQDGANFNELTIVGSAYAGHPYLAPLHSGQAIRITTGAPMPTNSDCVIPQELASVLTPNLLDLQNHTLRAGQHVRKCGEDLTKGSIAIPSGTRLGPAELGLTASLGIAKIAVQRRLRIGIFSTGDELRSLGEPLPEGCIYDSNRITLLAMAKRFGAEVLDFGVIADDPDTLSRSILHAVEQTDVLITSGGVSTGAADYTKQVVQKLGEMQFFSIQLRPGKPFAFGKIRQQNHTTTYLFALPGNPVAAMLSFFFLVRPALHLLQGEKNQLPTLIPALTTHAISKKIGRTEIQRGRCHTAQEQLHVQAFSEQSSGMLSSMTTANCLVFLDESLGNIATGEMVSVLLFDGLW